MPDYVHALYTSVKNTWQDAENLDGEHGYVSYIWIPEETYAVDVMRLRIFTEKFRAHSKSALGGGAAVVTSEVTQIPHTHDVAVGTKTSDEKTPNHTHDVAVGTKTSAAGGASHTHDVAIGTKTSAGGGEHRHEMFRWVGTPPDVWDKRHYYGRNAAGNTRGVLLEVVDTSSLYTYETVTDHDHDVVIGTVTSQAKIASHTHDVVVGTVTSAAGGGTHSHDVAIGTVTSESGGGSHAHDVDVPEHTHDIDFGIYEEDIAGRTLSAVLYDPHGNVVKDFGVVVTGEDNDELDLSDYFETLQYGMYKVVLTASARLRARLLFYELCKMYAQS